MRDLERLVAPGHEALAREAFDRLWSAVCPSLRRWLNRRGVAREDGEDALQRAAAQLWRNRGSLRAASPGEWFALARRATRRCVGEGIATHERAREAEAEIVPQDTRLFDALVLASMEAERAYDCADRLWLGEPRAGGAAIASAALQQVLLEGASEEYAALMFGVGAADVRTWLADPAVVARALFASLCWPGDELAGYVLRPERPVSPGELDEVAASGELDRWNAVEALAVVWRARDGLREEEIRSRSQDGLHAFAVEDLVRRYRGALPFRGAACALLACLEARGLAGALSSTGLRRIAFEYGAGHELPREQIEERADPPARMVGARVDVATLRNWLGMRRLYA